MRIACRVTILFLLTYPDKCLVGRLCLLLRLRLSSSLYSPPAEASNAEEDSDEQGARAEDADPEYEDPSHHNVSLMNTIAFLSSGLLLPPELPP